ncbi:uncharacterized protein LOC112689025 [Sipha flava]|jgi:hypothetical protein|uniref:Uncharacterized protein LOC112689025 n=1 Tax=Sipha flava TaxID=143950 RepID=A0A8B8G5X2_9HEMI|nr:uncharacterized protein LOC112689025 [Sipha flava]XP_025418307.1 uncharacterized protein LOC112689025 [Sipha flava]
MASWLFGASKLKTDPIEETKDTQPVPTADLEPRPAENLPTMPNTPYSLQPNVSKLSDQDVKPTSMLDSIPFVLSSKINMNTNNYTNNLEDTKRCLLSVKKILESDMYNYDFSNDRRLVNNSTTYVP